ncbi:MAG: PIN domain-containing protein [Isosphaeraceae bacterium]|nr:PIN domain-containing protein [Isosphaeraceae bacterium]
MRRVFAASLSWIALSLPKDQWRGAALQASRGLRGAEIVTTEEVLSEFLTAFRHTPQLRSIAARRVHQFTTTPNILVIPQSGQSFQAGFSLYQARPDKAYSLIDCIAMATMRPEGIWEVLTHDSHFAQEGFTLLL